MARNWRNSGLVGLLAALGSACWFTGFATAPVALVRVVGQVEVFFTLGFAHLYLAERVRLREAGALILIAARVVLALESLGEQADLEHVVRALGRHGDRVRIVVGEGLRELLRCEPAPA